MKKVIILPFENSSFKSRKKGDQIHPDHPGTAIKIGEEIFEIKQYFIKNGKHYYTLEPWDERFVIRTIIEWNEEEEKKFIEESLKEKRKEKIYIISFPFQIFLGFLPESYQNKLEEKIGLNPPRATFWSSLFEFVFSLSVIVLNMISSFGGLYGANIKFVPKWLVVLCFFTILDGLARLFYNIATNEPVGSFLFILLELKIKKEKSKYEEDSFKFYENNLIVETPYEKKHWEKWKGIKFEGKNYLLEEKNFHKNFYIYKFRNTEESYPKTSIEKEKNYNSSSDASIVFAPLWGFLPAELQREIEFYGRYNPFKFTKLSIIFNLIFSSSLLISRGFKLFSNKFFIFDILVLIFSILLLLESIKRFQNFYEKKQISGSFLGFLFKPFFYILFK